MTGPVAMPALVSNQALAQYQSIHSAGTELVYLVVDAFLCLIHLHE